MNLTSPLLLGAAHMAELPGESVASFLKMIGDFTGLFAGDGADGGLGMVMSGLAGVATALAVAIVLSVYFRIRYRSPRDVLRHGLAAALVLALVAFVAYDMRHAALAYLGINPPSPAVVSNTNIIATNNSDSCHTPSSPPHCNVAHSVNPAAADDTDGTDGCQHAEGVDRAGTRALAPGRLDLRRQRVREPAEIRLEVDR